MSTGRAQTDGEHAGHNGRSLREYALRGMRLDGILVIDNHCHVGPYAAFYWPGNSAADMVRTMDRIGIDQGCVFSTLACTIDMRRGNDLSLATAREFPGRLLAYTVPDPNHPKLIKDELQRCYDAGSVGIKFHTQLHNYPFNGPAYEPAFAFADAHRLPLISHGVGSPDILRGVARTYPGCHFIVAHVGGGPPQRDALGAVAAEESNVYLDLASSVGGFGAFVTMVREVGARKLLFGSDTPCMCFTHQIGRVLLTPIPEADKRLILGENMAALLATRR